MFKFAGIIVSAFKSTIVDFFFCAFFFCGSLFVDGLEWFFFFFFFFFFFCIDYVIKCASITFQPPVYEGF